MMFSSAHHYPRHCRYQRMSHYLLLGVASQGSAQSGANQSTDTAKKFMAIPDGSGVARFYGKNGSSMGRADTGDKTTRFYSRDGSSAVQWTIGQCRLGYYTVRGLK
jgi:hypothetical protein